MNKIKIIKESINIIDSKNILKYYYSLDKWNIKEWLKEITPFTDFTVLFKNDKLNKKVLLFFYNLFWYFKFKFWLSKYKNFFTYRFKIFRLKELEKDKIFLKLSKNNKNIVFLTIEKKSIKKWKNIIIDKIISIEKWYWTIVIKELCKYYNIYNIVVFPSVYWKWFWEKIQKRFRWKINITIK